MKWLFTSIFLLLPTLLMSQECECSAELSFVISYFEKNNPAFQKVKAIPHSYQAYLKEVEKISAKASTEPNNDHCILYLDQYVTLLKDHHSGIGFNLKRTDMGSVESIRAFKNSANYKQFKKLQIDTSEIISILKAKKTEDVEGIYTDGRSIVFGIIRKDKSADEYLGVVLKENKLLDAGHILLELTLKPDSTYDVTYNIGLLGFNFQKILKNIAIENGQIAGLGFSKTETANNRKKWYEFKGLSETTNYLRLGSFDSRITQELDSLYNASDMAIRSKPYLIIDLRGNGGGSEKSYLNLLKYAYTKPLKIDSAIIWVSPDNITRYEEQLSESTRELVERMKAAKPYSFMPFSEDTMHTWALDSSLLFPEKIALLFDRGTASAAEGMILYYMQSEKVITIGENSGGYIGYGNVMTTQTPCGKYTVQSTTTQYFEKSKYEFTGIEPMYKASRKKDWTDYAYRLLNKTW